MALAKIEIPSNYNDGLIIGHSWYKFGFQNHIQKWVDTSGYSFDQIVEYNSDRESDLDEAYRYYLIGEEEGIVEFKLRWL